MRSIHSPKTVKNAYGLLSASLNAAQPGLRLNVTLPQREVHEYHVPTDAEVKLMLDAAPRNLRIAILLASIGTLRRSECAGLAYEDIKGRTIHVHQVMVKTVDNTYELKPFAKNDSSDRYIEMPQQVIDEIGTGEGLIINCTLDALTDGYIRLRKKFGITSRFHDLRHYSASIMHAIGIPDQYIMERGGWKSDGILKSVYRNVLSDKEKEFSDRMNGYMGKLWD